MEDLWKIQDSAIELGEFADMIEYKRYLDRFRKDEERRNQRILLYGGEDQKE